MHHAPVGIGHYRGHGAAGDAALRARLEAALDRIAAVDPILEAFLPESDRRTRVLAEFDRLCERHKDPSPRPPLFGVPLGVKDIFRVDGLPTRAGSKLPAELFAGKQAESISRLRAAGAIVMGKTVTTEFAYFAPGPTRNPWNPAHTPGGSSSGSAAAVSAGFCAFALGTQTIGSIARPASYCGVVGFKPSYGAVSTAGVIPFSESADHVGLLAADMATARAAAAALAVGQSPAPAGGTAEAPAAGLPRLLLLDDAYTAQADAEANAAVRAAAQRLEAAGYPVTRVALFDDIAEINDRHIRLVAREFADVHSIWVRDYRSLYDARNLDLISSGRTVSNDALSALRGARFELHRRVDELLTAHEAAAILSPSAPGPAPEGIGATGSPLLNLPWTAAGVPTVTLPCARAANGLPLGVQVAGAFGSDGSLLALSAALEAELTFS